VLDCWLLMESSQPHATAALCCVHSPHPPVRHPPGGSFSSSTAIHHSYITSRLIPYLLRFLSSNGSEYAPNLSPLTPLIRRG